MPYLGIFGLIFGETIAICEISIFRFVKMQSFMFKGKKSYLLPKMPYLGIFVLEFEKAIFIIEISPFELVKMQSFKLTENKN